MFTTIQEAYDNGFKTGLTWDHDWIPGGPHVYSPSYRANEEYKEFCKFSQQCHDEWIRGWKDGVETLKDLRNQQNHFLEN